MRSGGRRPPPRTCVLRRRARGRLAAGRRISGNHNEVQDHPRRVGGTHMTIRPAVPDDAAEITAIIHELAAFERAAAECTVTEAQMKTALFGATPIARAFVAEVDGQI